ncbi:hypothetical protein ACLESD_36800, partial [Pyxidicoccus sp. 3LFB2]
MTPDAPPLPEPTSRARINLEWLLRLRWGLLLGQALVIAVAAYGLQLALPVPVLGALLGLEALTNLSVRAWLHGDRRVTEGTIGKLMLWDTLVLTGLLALSGGTHNPFTTLYLVNVALGTVLLPARWTWGLLGFTLAAFGSLFVLQDVELPLELSRPDHAELMRLHINGMWVAFAVAAGFIVYFVQRVTRALGAREQELAQARALHSRREKVASLATLAAGAAHSCPRRCPPSPWWRRRWSARWRPRGRRRACARTCASSASRWTAAATCWCRCPRTRGRPR